MSEDRIKVKVHDFAILIERVGNGYIVRDMADVEEGEVPCITVFEEGEDELETTRCMLMFVMESFGVFWSKHNKRNLVVKVEGDRDAD